MRSLFWEVREFELSEACHSNRELWGRPGSWRWLWISLVKT